LANFYSKAFELSVVQINRHDDGSLRSIWLALDSGVLMIEESEEELRVVKGRGAGPFLLAFEVSQSERETVEGKIVSHGGSLEQRSEHTTYGRDPEGNRVAISCYPLPVAQ
jgi:hypothetical protein